MPDAHVALGEVELPLRLGTSGSEVVEVPGSADVVFRGSGWDPGEPLVVHVGHRERPVRADGRGTFALRWEEALRAVAGQVTLAVERSTTEDVIAIEIVVLPTRFAEDALRELLADLEALAPGLAGDLAGTGRAQLARTSPAEATLRALLGAIPDLETGVTRVRHRPIVRRHDEVHAIPVADARGVGARDARWVARNPHRALSAQARGAAVGVLRREHTDLDTGENRGVVALLRHLDALAAALRTLVSAERSRLHARREVREAFRTRHGSLWSEQDVPALAALAQRDVQIGRVEEQIALARRALGFPPSVRAGPFLLTDRVQSHPGYWSLYRLWSEVRDLLPLEPGAAMAPLRNTDQLYEVWCAVTMATALARLADRALDEVLEAPVEAWFASLPRGRLASVEVEGWEVVLLYEPEYAAEREAPAHAEAIKLHPGRPWAPDLALELRSGGRLVELHVFDAKHSVDPAHALGVPRRDADEVWLKYADSIGAPDTGLPLVASCWVLFPARHAHPWLRSPAMLSPAWPPERCRGGALPLTPGGKETVEVLVQVLATLTAR